MLMPIKNLSNWTALLARKLTIRDVAKEKGGGEEEEEEEEEVEEEEEEEWKCF